MCLSHTIRLIATEEPSKSVSVSLSAGRPWDGMISIGFREKVMT